MGFQTRTTPEGLVIVCPDGVECGPYRDTEEYEDDLLGLMRFFRAREHDMKITRSAGVALFVALGFKTAAEWPVERLRAKIVKIHDILDEIPKLENEETVKLLNELLTHVKGGGDVEIEDDMPAAAKAPKAPKAPKDPNAPPRTAPKKAGEPGKPGVFKSMVEFLSAASEAAPITEEDILKKLAERFPDRPIEGMKSSFKQINSDLKIKGMPKMLKNDKGYWIVLGEQTQTTPPPAPEAASSAAPETPAPVQSEATSEATQEAPAPAPKKTRTKKEKPAEAAPATEAAPEVASA